MCYICCKSQSIMELNQQSFIPYIGMYCNKIPFIYEDEHNGYKPCFTYRNTKLGYKIIDIVWQNKETSKVITHKEVINNIFNLS